MNKREEERLRKQQEKLEKEIARTEAMSVYEKEYSDHQAICGIDEVGRGPFAGPVVAGAVILPKDHPILYLNDSKKLSEKKREELYEVILKEHQCVSLKTLAVTGKDLIQAGYKPGREIGETLNRLLEEVLADPQKNQKEILLDMLDEK